jgi:N-acetylglucosaminyl-diphospho-decaprenol L-rhamnosyltransferase
MNSNALAEENTVALPSHCNTAGISIIIPHYGDAQQTKSLVDQLLKQEASRSIEIVVSDDASPIPFPIGNGYMVIRDETNGGFGAAVNRGAQLATMPFLMILNSDISIDSYFVEHFASVAMSFLPSSISGVCLIGGKVASELPRKFPKNRHYFLQDITVFSRWRDRTLWKRLIGIYVGNNFPMTVDWVVGAVMGLPTEIFWKVGGFDERYHMYMEEVDLQYRLKQIGIPSVYFNHIVVNHASFGSAPNSIDRGNAVLNSRKLYCKKWRGTRGLRCLQSTLTLSATVNVTINVIRRIAGRPIEPLNQYRDRLKVIWQDPMPNARIVR